MTFTFMIQAFKQNNFCEKMTHIGLFDKVEVHGVKGAVTERRGSRYLQGEVCCPTVGVGS